MGGPSYYWEIGLHGEAGLWRFANFGIFCGAGLTAFLLLLLGGLNLSARFF
jgi:hypothetical protein